LGRCTTDTFGLFGKTFIGLEMNIGDIVLAENTLCDEELMGIITGFVYKNNEVDLAQVYFPVINFKDYVLVGLLKVIA